MALNVSHDSVCWTHPLCGNGYQMEEFPVDNSSGFWEYVNFNWELENFQDCITEKTEEELDDLLPSDPFGMDLSTTFTAITGWLEDIESNLGSNSHGFVHNQGEAEAGEYMLFAELNSVWNGPVMFHPEAINSKIKEASLEFDKELWAGLCNGGLLLDGNEEDFMGFSIDEDLVSGNAAIEFQGYIEIHSDSDGGAPHDALFFALGYLGVRDLLSIERVCKSLRDAVRNDSFLWRSIHIDHPLSEKITDDALLQLSSRAQGTLQSLSLVDCLRITDSGLRDVLESNPGLTKLSVPGCVRLGVEGILCNLKAFKSAGKLGIKQLRIGGLYGITNQQFEELNLLLGADNLRQPSAHQPRFYQCGQLYISCDDDRAIDIEACPRCHRIRQVYDCPAESCQVKHKSTQSCRACTFCIPRCMQCGRCIDGCDFEETFCLDLLCLDCWKRLLNCQNRQEEMGHSSKCIVHQASHQFCLCG